MASVNILNLVNDLGCGSSVRPSEKAAEALSEFQKDFPNATYEGFVDYLIHRLQSSVRHEKRMSTDETRTLSHVVGEQFFRLASPLLFKEGPIDLLILSANQMNTKLISKFADLLPHGASASEIDGLSKMFEGVSIVFCDSDGCVEKALAAGGAEGISSNPPETLTIVNMAPELQSFEDVFNFSSFLPTRLKRVAMNYQFTLESGSHGAAFGYTGPNKSVRITNRNDEVSIHHV